LLTRGGFANGQGERSLKDEDMKLIITILTMAALTMSAFSATNVVGHALPDGNLYTGEIASNLPQGLGRISNTNEITFIGIFNPQPTFGIMNWPKGDFYLGEVANDQMEGMGCFVSQGGLIYSGPFKAGKSDGFGTGIHTNFYYVGEWKNGKMEGKGAIQWKDGRRYVGEFKNMKCHGKGTIWFPDGCVFTGQFVDDDIDGEGTKYSPDGTILTGKWKKDQFLGQSSEPAR
jgi:hypothetical protein